MTKILKFINMNENLKIIIIIKIDKIVKIVVVFTKMLKIRNDQSHQQNSSISNQLFGLGIFRRYSNFSINLEGQFGFLQRSSAKYKRRPPATLPVLSFTPDRFNSYETSLHRPSHSKSMILSTWLIKFDLFIIIPKPGPGSSGLKYLLISRPKTTPARILFAQQCCAPASANSRNSREKEVSKSTKGRFSQPSAISPRKTPRPSLVPSKINITSPSSMLSGVEVIVALPPTTTRVDNVRCTKRVPKPTQISSFEQTKSLINSSIT